MRVGRSIRSSVVAAFAAIVCLATASSSSAMVFVNQSQWTGSRSTPSTSGVVAGGDWATTGIKISWTITFDGSVYTYVYTLSDDDGSAIDGGAPSHFITEVSPTFTRANILAGSSTVEGGSPQTFDSGNGNPNMPGSVFGIKWDFGSTLQTYTLKTNRTPIWGDFYIKGGGEYAYNTGFGTDPNEATTGFTNWIPTPDTVGPPPGEGVPTPSAAAAGVVLGGFLIARKLKRRVKA
jgi:hypothetical protein